jgi:NAD(P)-dependent dehydrogenase (short-subunit alcohol dehydrogenase family)
MLARRAERLDALSSALHSAGVGRAVAYGCDATSEGSIRDALSSIRRDLGIPDLVVYCVEGFHPGRSLDVEVSAFEDSWRHTCLGAFIVAREAGRLMTERGGGTIVFIGASSSVHGRPGYLNLAVGKFGVRGMAQVMAKEWSAAGVHVAHLLIDGGIEEEGMTMQDGRVLLDADAVADTVWSLHAQPRRAWTHELDVRAGDEAWWQRC